MSLCPLYVTLEHIFSHLPNPDCLHPSAWSTTKDMNLLPAKEIKAFLEQPAGRKSSKLREAYETAQDPTEWEAKMAEVDKATKEWEEEAALAADNAEEDQLEEDEEPADEEEDGSKKRKRKESKPKETEEAAKKRKKAKLMDLKKKATVSRPGIFFETSGYALCGGFLSVNGLSQVDLSMRDQGRVLGEEAQKVG